MTIKSAFIIAAALPMATTAFFSGCTAADDYMEERRAVREEKAAKAKADAEEAAHQKAIREREDRRAAQARENTVKAAVPLSTSNPSAWFHETDETMLEIQKRLVATIQKMDRMVAKYEGQAKEAADKSGGYPKLLAQLEAAKAADKWPVAVGRFFLDSAEKCDAKIAEVNEASGNTAETFIKIQAILNGAKEGAKAGRASLKQFDKDYAEFKRRWDMWIADQTIGIPKELQKQVTDAVATTQIWLDKWESVE